MRVQLTSPARRQADVIDRWWRQNRRAAPALFAQEFAEARRLLASAPETGAPYTERQGVLVRRLLLPKTANHVYYQIDRGAGVVMILAIWGTPRGREPTL